MPRKAPLLPMHDYNVKAILEGRMIMTFRGKPLEGWYRLADSGKIVKLRPQSPPHRWPEMSEPAQLQAAQLQGWDTVEQFVEANKRVAGFKKFREGKVAYYACFIDEIRDGEYAP